MACHCHRFMSSKHTSDHHLKTYSEYNDLDEEGQVETVLDYFRSKVGYNLIHEMYNVQPHDFKGEIDLHDVRVKQVLKKFGIEKRDIDIFNFLLNTYANTESYLAKKVKQHPPHFTSQELLSFHIWNGDLGTDKALDKLERKINTL